MYVFYTWPFKTATGEVKNEQTISNKSINNLHNYCVIIKCNIQKNIVYQCIIYLFSNICSNGDIVWRTGCLKRPLSTSHLLPFTVLWKLTFSTSDQRVPLGKKNCTVGSLLRYPFKFASNAVSTPI